MIYANHGINGQQNSNLHKCFTNVQGGGGGGVCFRDTSVSKDDLPRFAGGEISKQPLLMGGCVPTNLFGVLCFPLPNCSRAAVRGWVLTPPSGMKTFLLAPLHLGSDALCVFKPKKEKEKKKPHIYLRSNIHFTEVIPIQNRNGKECLDGGGGGVGTPLQLFKKMEPATERDQRRSAAETSWAWGCAASMRGFWLTVGSVNLLCSSSSFLPFFLPSCSPTLEDIFPIALNYRISSSTSKDYSRTHSGFYSAM